MTSPLELFCDRSLGHHKVPHRLRQVHSAVIAHDDVFAQDTDDEVWLKIAGERGWVVLTRDDRIRYRPSEQRALVEAGTAVTAEEWAEAFVAALPKILRSVAKNPSGGYIMGVNRNGKLRHLFPKSPVAD
jgi:uncharacterized protein with PIN domain